MISVYLLLDSNDRWVKLRFEEAYVTRAGMITKGHLSVLKTFFLEGNVTNGGL